MLERILVPLDGSPFAETILTQVRRLLLRKDAEVLLLQSVDLPLMAGGGGAAAMYESTFRALEEGAKQYIQGQERKLAEQGVRVRGLVRTGFAAEAILATAVDERVSLISMTTHGRTGLSRWALGSVAEKVVRAGAVPVLLNRSFGAGRPASSDELRFRKILVPIDLSDLSMQVIPHVAELAHLYESKVWIVNVCGEKSSCDDPVHQMTRAFDQFKRAGILVEPVMKVGDPAVRILEAAKDQSVDLIAMTTHGRSGVSRWALGSVTEKVLRASEVPMLVVRASQPT